jgi:hypothetical protein
MVFFLGLPVGRLYDMGYFKFLIGGGSLIYLFSYVHRNIQVSKRLITCTKSFHALPHPAAPLLPNLLVTGGRHGTRHGHDIYARALYPIPLLPA